MPDIVLATLNAKYPHAAFGLRYLMANLGDLQPRAALLEFEIHDAIPEIAERILAQNPRILGLGIYIWNVTPATQLVALLKQLQPGLTIVLGGPEVSYETDAQPIAALADFVVTGEADLTFAEVCRQILAGQQPAAKIIPAELPQLDRLALPYPLYTDEDVAHRVIYVEASRGCPFSCEFCLSSLDIPVRQFPLQPLLASLQSLLDRGVRQFKFVDRTFNLNIATSAAILEFFLARHRPGLFVHFEMIPDRLPDGLRALISRFPPGSLQFEVGVQTFNEQAAQLISRRQDNDRLAANFQFLREKTGVHIHADLIIGLPGESEESFGRGFDRLLSLGPQEIQVGILKRLRGTPIVRHDAEWSMVYDPQPPYEILQNKLIPAGDMQRLRRFARFWDIIGNSGNFITTTTLLCQGVPSPFQEFMRLSELLQARFQRQHSIPLLELAEFLFNYLVNDRSIPSSQAAATLLRDYQSAGRTDVPVFLRPHLAENSPAAKSAQFSSVPKRQRRHLLARTRLPISS